jgi:hypothetical protein
MRMPTLVPAIALLLAVATGCGGTQAAALSSVGDSCLVGSWTLQHQENKSSYSYSGVPLSVTGLGGAKLTIKSDGTRNEVFDGSSPLVGTTAGGQHLVITITGSVSFKVHGDGHKYVETGSRRQLPTIATIDGVPVSGYQSSYAPAQGTYQCAGPSLTTTTTSGLQIETWSKG